MVPNKHPCKAELIFYRIRYYSDLGSEGSISFSVYACASPCRRWCSSISKCCRCSILGAYHSLGIFRAGQQCSLPIFCCSERAWAHVQGFGSLVHYPCSYRVAWPCHLSPSLLREVRTRCINSEFVVTVWGIGASEGEGLEPFLLRSISFI